MILTVDSVMVNESATSNRASFRPGQNIRVVKSFLQLCHKGRFAAVRERGCDVANAALSFNRKFANLWMST